MMHEAQPEPGAEGLRDRLSRLSEASLRINESLDLDTVLARCPGRRLLPDRRPLWRHHHPGRVGRSGRVPNLGAGCG